MPTTPIQFLRSAVLGRRPNPANLLAGQPAVNVNSQQPGLFFRDNTGNSLFKVGPSAVGSNPPTLSPCLGESWVQTDGGGAGVPILWVYDGTHWKGVPLTQTYTNP